MDGAPAKRLSGAVVLLTVAASTSVTSGQAGVQLPAHLTRPAGTTPVNRLRQPRVISIRPKTTMIRLSASVIDGRVPVLVGRATPAASRRQVPRTRQVATPVVRHTASAVLAAATKALRFPGRVPVVNVRVQIRVAAAVALEVRLVPQNATTAVNECRPLKVTPSRPAIGAIAPLVARAAQLRPRPTVLRSVAELLPRKGLCHTLVAAQPRPTADPHPSRPLTGRDMALSGPDVRFRFTANALPLLWPRAVDVSQVSVIYATKDILAYVVFSVATALPSTAF